MDIRQQSIIKYSTIILEHLLKFKEAHPDFTFSLRQRDFAKADSPKRLENGQWFQGSDYIFVPLFKIGDSARKIKTFGFAINFDKNGNIESSSITISFKGGVTNRKDINFHKSLAKEIGIELNHANCGDYFFENPNSIEKNLEYFLNTIRPIAIRLLNEFNLVDKYTYSETDFQKYLSRINEIRNTSAINYWIFQGSPKIYDAVSALNNNAITTWTVSAHKDKIKKGDKFILWLTGLDAGCYALGTIASEVAMMKEEDVEMGYYLSPTSQIENARVKITIDYNLSESPVLWEMIKEDETYLNFKGSNQGTNFTATKEEYDTFLEFATSKNNDYKEVKELLDQDKVAVFLSILKNFVTSKNIKSNDSRISFNVRKNRNRLVFIIGNKYAFAIEKRNLKTEFWLISKERLSDKHTTFINHKSEIEAYWNNFTDIKKIIPTIAIELEAELNKNSKCPYRKFTNNDFINDVYQNNVDMENPTIISEFPLNQILYGPPGTGKTYNTVLEAAKIITGNEAIGYAEALKVFNANLGQQIEFITFHQNYSYEDFIQGLRPDTENGSALTFEKKDGVFKRIADRAYENLISSYSRPEESNRLNAFLASLERLKEKVIDSEEPIYINETAYFVDVEENAFRYTGKNWTLGEKGFTGFRMKYSDLIELFKANVQTRQDIKKLNTVSGLAKQHASYFVKAYQLILNDLKDTEVNTKIDRKNYVIIIDEINRANISRVFGELITLIEEDKRSHGAIPMRVTLPSGDPFIVPSNLYIIGTMNTADKSIALLDIALRRRFEFVPKYPDVALVKEEYKLLFEKMNAAIKVKKTHDFTVGHAYFMEDRMTLNQIINHKVIPLLLEYFMNSEEQVIEIMAQAGVVVGGWPLQMKGIND